MSENSSPADRAYFFDGGLNFQCTGCGMCCTGASGTIFVNEREGRAIADHLGTAYEVFLEKFAYPVEGGHSLRELPGGDCIFLNGNLCGIYEVRPTQCRTYPFWPEILRSEQVWRGEASACEGIGRGPRHDRETIMRELNRTLEECADAEW